ncbi:hypothetical protein [Parapedobacter soli]|uniref:hypothetical protein n=1 Tax=Parapedobacter soli TaxID=416955 RepID=UPI0021C6DCBD|nr:hypothetical protein [Parapedobacter soli]
MKRVDMVYRSMFGMMVHYLLDGIIQHGNMKAESDCTTFGSEFLNDSIRMVEQPLRQMND